MAAQYLFLLFGGQLEKADLEKLHPGVHQIDDEDYHRSLTRPI